MRWTLVFLAGCAFADPVVGTLTTRQASPSCLPSALVCSAPSPLAPVPPALGALMAMSVDTTTELRDVQWSALDIELQAGVTLRLSGGTLRGARVHGAGSLEVAGCALEDVTIELDSLWVDRAQVTRASLRAGRAELTSTRVQELTLQVDELWAAELTGSAVSLEVARATLASVELQSLGATRCTSMHLVTSRLDRAALSCTSELRISRGVVADSWFSGPITSEATLWDNNVFDTASRLQSREDVFFANQLCGANLALVETASLGCNACAPSAAVCTREVDLAFVANDNPNCLALANPPLCPDVR